MQAHKLRYPNDKTLRLPERVLAALTGAPSDRDVLVTKLQARIDHEHRRALSAQQTPTATTSTGTASVSITVSPLGLSLQPGVAAATAPSLDLSSARTVIAPVPQTVATSSLDANAVPFSLHLTSAVLPPQTPSSAQPMMPQAQRDGRQSTSDAARSNDEQSAILSVAGEANLKLQRINWEKPLRRWETWLAALRGSAADQAVSYHHHPLTNFFFFIRTERV